jgi:hypothetical protein
MEVVFLHDHGHEELGRRQEFRSGSGFKGIIHGENNASSRCVIHALPGTYHFLTNQVVHLSVKIRVLHLKPQSESPERPKGSRNKNPSTSLRSRMNHQSPVAVLPELDPDR